MTSLSDRAIGRFRVPGGEWSARCDLSALYRAIYRLGWSDFIYTHLSVRVPGEADHFLINNFGEMFDEVTASSLVKLDMDGNVTDHHGPEDVNDAGFVIHSAVYLARPDVNCVIHLHTRAGIAVSAQRDGLLPLSQHSMMVASDLSYHDYDIAAGRLEERAALAESCASANAVLLRNHGSLVMGHDVPSAFERAYYLETSCQIQVETMACSQDIGTIGLQAWERGTALAAEYFASSDAGQRMWTATVRALERAGLSDYSR